MIGCRRLISLLLTVGLCLTTAIPVAFANAGLLHRSKDGETYANLADRYYGRRYLEQHLRQLNRHAEPLAKGTPVIIPTLRKVRVDQPMSVREFAGKHLQDPDRAGYLKALNRLTDDELSKDDTVLVGQSLGHVVRRGETLKSIARTYYRDVRRRRLKLLRLYNKLPTNRVRPGMALRIPLDSKIFLAKRVKARAAASPPAVARATSARSDAARFAPVRSTESPSNGAPPDANAAPSKRKRKARPAKKKASVSRKRPAKPASTRNDPSDREDRVAAALENAERKLSEGDYASALSAAEKALRRHRSAPKAQRVELFRVRATALIALDRPADAKVVFKRLVALDPSYRLDLYSTSPKVLDVFQSIEAPGK